MLNRLFALESHRMSVRELRAGSVVLALLCAVYYVFGLPH